ncbi:type II toxin-antitoxin system HipA family toxin [Massilia sp. NR 4-1]|uniref:type II toxin-antitoxin system HipA family toxin n=1 Tax=Massilia sp. NR 4-1 TaxID=1678028 RepID=UPI00067C59FD|nr:type II toxin-antitoxin system HipA family toxin [Massilia sp. NR 4-1]AKU23511.1 toxin HipA [Massilia sp. NR 4-1]
MSRSLVPRSLGLWVNGIRVGTWSQHRPREDILEYDVDWVNANEAWPLSLSLPFLPGNASHHGQVVSAYFENLLPDSWDIRVRLAGRYKVDPGSSFELLEQIGRDCVGALQILPDGVVPLDVRSIDATPLAESEVAKLLRNAVAPGGYPNGSYQDVDDFRICIAGAQEKTALLFADGRWCKPHGSTPTTHILKLPMGLVGNMRADMSASVENEWLCSLILREFGLPVAQASPMQFEEVKVLSVERFDRQWDHNSDGTSWVSRLAQEDFCQATGTPPSLKYEADGGPGMGQIMRVLEGSASNERDRRIFFQAQVLFWMLAATDGHAKNFSLVLHAGGRYELTQLYDVLSAYPVLGGGSNQISPHKAKMAMAMRSKNVHWKIRDVLRRHLDVVGTAYGICTPDGRGVCSIIDELIERTPRVVQVVSEQLPSDFPHHLADGIFDGLQAAAQRLAISG